MIADSGAQSRHRAIRATRSSHPVPACHTDSPSGPVTHCPSRVCVGRRSRQIAHTRRATRSPSARSTGPGLGRTGALMPCSGRFLTPGQPPPAGLDPAPLLLMRAVGAALVLDLPSVCADPALELTREEEPYGTRAISVIGDVLHFEAGPRPARAKPRITARLIPASRARSVFNAAGIGRIGRASCRERV